MPSGSRRWRRRPRWPSGGAFVDAAVTAEQEVAECCLVYDADAVFSYLQDTLAGKRAKRPKAVKL